MNDVVRCSDAWLVAYKSYLVAWALTQPIYAYNFFVYIIVGHRFRCELHQLFRCWRDVSAAGSNARANTAEDADDDYNVNQRVSLAVTSF